MTDPQATKFPLADLNPDEKTAIYIGVLERRVAYQETMMLQYRALLEALTGEQWDVIDTRIKKSEVMAVARNAFERRMARSMAEAEKIVDRNISAANGE